MDFQPGDILLSPITGLLHKVISASLDKYELTRNWLLLERIGDPNVHTWHSQYGWRKATDEEIANFIAYRIVGSEETAVGF